MKEIEDGVFEIPLFLHGDIEKYRIELEELLLSAQRRLKVFAHKHGWGDLVKESFADRAEIFDDKCEFNSSLKKIAGVDEEMELPKTYSAALENRVFMAVSPRLYADNYPEGSEKDSYEKLITHEMAHRLHIRILKEDEEAMGPIWFFEGFAIYAAGQFEDLEIQLSPEKIKGIIENDTRGDYRNYGLIIRHLLKTHSLQDLVKRSGKV